METGCHHCLSAFDADEHLPKLLPCSHTICLSCLLKQRNLFGKSQCPKCLPATVAALAPLPTMASLSSNPTAPKSSLNGFLFSAMPSRLPPVTTGGSLMINDDIFLSDSDDSTTSSVTDHNYFREEESDHFVETHRLTMDADEQKLADARKLLNVEKKRLDKIVQACDKLKQETVRKISLQPFNELMQYRELLDGFRVDVQKSVVDDDTNGLDKRLDLSQKINALHQNIDLAYENIKAKNEVMDRIRDSSITVGFYRTPLTSAAKDEIVINFARDDVFPSGLYIACCMLQDVFQQCMKHEQFQPRNNNNNNNAPLSRATIAPTPTGAIATMQPRYNGSDHSKLIQPPSSTATLPASGTTAAAAVLKNSKGLKTNGSTPVASSTSTWSEVSKQFCPPASSLPRPEKTVAETNRPHCFFDVRIIGNRIVRVVIRVRPDKAPFMSENFIQLCLGKKGFSYKGCKFFRCKPDDHVVCGDFEYQNGSGGHSAFGEAKLFLAEQCPLKDHKGAVRMRGIERTTEGRCRVGSQFMVWVGDIDYKEYKYTLVFGEVTQGLQHLQEISRIGMIHASNDTWLLKEEVVIMNCGVL